MQNSNLQILDNLEIPDSLLMSWQETVDLMADLFSAPAALIMRTHAKTIEVLVASRSEGNVYRQGETAPLNTGLYCETVMATHKALLVSNALKDPDWDQNPDIALNMISYYGLPLTWPYGETFGTICVLDNKENDFSKKYQDVLKRFQQSVLYGLEAIYQRYFYAQEVERANQKIGIMLQAMQQSPTALAILDNEFQHVYSNPSFDRLSGDLNGRGPGQVRNESFGLEIDARTGEEIHGSLAADNIWEGEVRVGCGVENENRWEKVCISRVLDESGDPTNYLICREDITRIKKNEEKLRQLALFDQLTGLPNRSLVIDRLFTMIEAAGRSGKMIAVLFIDLDDFKKINDSMGHESGDELIVTLSGRLKRVIRSSDTLGRFGGDEFVILMSNLDSVDPVHRLLSDLQQLFSESCDIKNRSFRISASIGVALYPVDGDSPSLLFRYSDLAMYHSKAAGRDRYTFYTSSMNQTTEKQLRLEEQLHKALELDELEVFYQPQICIASGKTIGFEALIRWQNPVLGQVSPNEFIPIAEQSGLILSIGRFVIERALAQLAIWQKSRGPHLKMAVNVSPRQFHDPSLIALIDETLAGHGLSNASLEVEITEGLLLSKSSHVFATMNQLRERGVTIAMDDFGSGYSSLSYLSHYPFNVIKIDRSFIRNITTDTRSRHLVKSIIFMAHGIGYQVIAEGVETEEQLDILTGYKCDCAQGYYFSKPLPADEIGGLT